MRVFICLSIFSFMLATCQEECFSDHLRPRLKDGKGVKPNTCVDRYDGKTHPIGSSWSTADCFVCECSRDGMRCCERERGIVLVERCKKGENPESCKDAAIGLDDKCQFIIPKDDIYIKILEELSVLERNLNKFPTFLSKTQLY
ncbi:small serum protein 4-like [Pantherophis guttatus]|uniref:Small serum protein 4-like n=1 Tax=Pantherophis guttatus TaxID=94885 RepID=A0ABM3YT37_PANGU|nr:small serum protein 4-like [Pantherophis guttatus]